MHTPTHGLLGREDELEAIARLLDDSRQQPRTAVLCGEAGIGKTELWLAGLREGRARGVRVLSTRPGEAETGYAYAGLADLLEPALGDVLPELPPLQRRAVETALLLGEETLPADERAVAAACLGAIRLLARSGPVLLAVDDLQWLDPATLAVLRFGLARLEDEPVASLLAVRGNTPDWVLRAVRGERLLELRLGGLSVGALHELLDTRLDATFARPTLIRIWEASAGNPLFALELAAALQRSGGALAPGEPLPIPADLHELLQARLDGLGRRALEVVQVVAALADATVELVEAALDVPCDDALAEALAARIVEVDGPRLRLTHPLLGSVVVARQTPARVRSLHARLAEVAPTFEERARHLALATAGRDADVAAVLDDAAARALARGAPTAAAELAEQALRLTPPDDREDVLRRTIATAGMHHRAGDGPRGASMLERALESTAPGNARATLLAALGELDESPRRIDLFRAALAEVDDPVLEAGIHISLATSARWGEGVEQGVAHAERAVEAASRVADPVVRCGALAAYGVTRFYAGHGIAETTMEEAVALERSLPDWPLREGPTSKLGHQLFWSAEVERGRAVFRELLAAARARNDPALEGNALWYLGFLAWRAGDWDEAERRIAASLDLVAQLGPVWPPSEFPAAILEAHTGRVEAARARARAASARGEAAGIRIAESGHGWVLGFVDLSLGDPVSALAHLRRSYEIRNTFMLEPAQRLELGDLLEALVAVGELDEAEAVLVPWEERARALDRAWALAILARCRGLLLAARGEVEAALPHFEHALAEHARSTDPFQHARTLLALGSTQRRAKQRAAARETLGQALAGFEQLGAPLWAEQARAELARIGGRTPTGDELTEAESRIAALVAEGKTNREVAAALFLTVHSVETALTRIYRKLGVRSRAELARRYPAKT